MEAGHVQNGDKVLLMPAGEQGSVKGTLLFSHVQFSWNCGWMNLQRLSIVLEYLLQFTSKKSFSTPSPIKQLISACVQYHGPGLSTQHFSRGGVCFDCYAKKGSSREFIRNFWLVRILSANLLDDVCCSRNL